MDSTTSRLRKTFRYPTDTSDTDSIPEAMDEEEQENLIKNLHEQNTNLNIQYTRILLALPLVCILPYLSALFALQTTFLSILSISSLLSTAWMVFVLPSGETGIYMLDNLNNTPATLDDGGVEYSKRVVHPEGPIRQYLPYLNVGLCLLLGVLGKLVRERGDGMWWVLSWLPAAVYVIVVCGKFVMGGVDPGRELEGLRYGFKGA
ncbi:hypothetical protein LHYA1_G000937 [Lachnellula hyalina]|uniref:Uncharacterized protein n=1 Tax=Lachnellula hyalina TaxID=1316788 RepID=A0A8H8R7E8_9HELO|nr:uncharacterized protein LHYA1_G000937 [Lachnellula hyalina]TVY29739.1 hypothetical protein LHYA1_G000937 [Lachnellula hyalina]